MRVSPQADGSLEVESPDEATRFDMGNQALFAAFNGRGDLTRLLAVEGFDPGRWRIDLEVDGQPVGFHQGRAIGRLWQLRAEAARLRIELDSYLDETSAAVHQRLTLDNPTSEDCHCTLACELESERWAHWRPEAVSRVARSVPRLPGLEHLWGRGWAKVIRPDTPREVVLAEGGAVQVRGTRRWTWGASRGPDEASTRGHQAYMRFRITVPPGGSSSLAWALTEGDELALREALAHSEGALHDAVEYAGWLRACCPVEDRLLQSLYVAGLNAAVAMFKQLPDGFAGLLAGPDYAYPPRLYFRDGYWTAQALLNTRPDLVRRHLLSLARGVHTDGACPSGVLASHLLRTWGRASAALDWLPDHYDAPPYFVLLLREYVRASGEVDILPAEFDDSGRSMWAAARQALVYMTTRDRDGDGLIEKPHQANDWADNVRRSTWVTYDQALYTAALQAGEDLAEAVGEAQSAERFGDLAVHAKDALNARLWDEERGYFVNYARPGFTESHFSIDTLLALYYGLVEPDRARRVLAAARRLQTRHNHDQPFGDWGVMCAFPPYRRRADLFSISAQPFHYHNGADWPYWDAVYAEVLLRQENPDWRYVLCRWWEHGLDQGRLTPVEYFSPAFPPGGLLQGWSAMPAAVLAKCCRWEHSPG